MPPPMPGSCSRRVEEAGVGEQVAGHRRQHRALPAALAEPPRHARGADHALAASMRGIRPEPCAARANSLCSSARAVGRQQPHAHLEMARPAFGQRMDRLQQHLHALRRQRPRQCARAGDRAPAACRASGARLASPSAVGSAVGHHDGTLPAGAWVAARGRARVSHAGPAWCARSPARPRPSGRSWPRSRWRGGASRRARRRSCC